MAETGREALLGQFGDPYTNRVLDRLHRFAFLPPQNLERLEKAALSETWGDKSFVLRKYLAVHVPWSIEQGRYSTKGDQIYVTAGHLQTRYGTPLYLVFEPNQTRAASRGAW